MDDRHATENRNAVRESFANPAMQKIAWRFRGKALSIYNGAALMDTVKNKNSDDQPDCRSEINEYSFERQNLKTTMTLVLSLPSSG